ncbi:hypothetical protein B0H66DRAFT_530094 [Apodospora peruviana]|uniref:Uncharacterized protein n=1 Tax=Apodospora peruviana TaxID=516989 RepID=A0AAE0MBY3_9PEZI|nr:hypothetical protein B0H66DRAFT_530094 [Apodospora peruviana]
MHQEWLASLTPKDITFIMYSEHPEWMMEKYYVDGITGEPDKSKSPHSATLELPYRKFFGLESLGLRCSNLSIWDTLVKLREAVKKVPGLHHATGSGPWSKTLIIGIIGWNKTAAEKAAKAHFAIDAKQKRANEKSVRDVSGPSPCGEYIVDCQEIKSLWEADDNNTHYLRLGIDRTNTAGVFRGTFDFGKVRGVMIIGRDKALVDRMSKLPSGGSMMYWRTMTAPGSKRKPRDVQRGTPPKKGKMMVTTGASRSGHDHQSLKFHIRVKSLVYKKIDDPEYGANEIVETVDMGVIIFGVSIGSPGGKMNKGACKSKSGGDKSPNPFNNFIGKIGLPQIGTTIAYTARKVDVNSDTSEDTFWFPWKDYR